MGGFFRPHELRAFVSRCSHVHAFEESLSPAQKHWRNREIQLVNEARMQVLLYGVRPSTNTHIFPVGGFARPIDLSTLHRSTYLGSGGSDRIDSLAVGNGKLYVTGGAGSNNFPVPGSGAITTWGSGSAFVAMLATDLSTIDGASYYLGNAGVSVAEVVLGGSDVFLTGSTAATTLPATEGSINTELSTTVLVVAVPTPAPVGLEV